MKFSLLPSCKGLVVREENIVENEEEISWFILAQSFAERKFLLIYFSYSLHYQAKQVYFSD